MDKEEQKDQAAAAFSFWVDGQVYRQQSPWRQNNLSGHSSSAFIRGSGHLQDNIVQFSVAIDSMEYINITASNDLEIKINAILSIIVQDDGDSFAKRAEMYYQKRPELIQMVEDLHKSYRSLANKYDQLRSEVNNDSHPRLLSLSRSINQVQGQQNDAEGKDSNFHSKSTAGDPDHETVLEDDSSNGQADEFTPDEEKQEINGIAFQRNTSDGSRAAMLENEKMWSELRFKVSELVGDNLSHQAELIRRNDEKRETIRDLCSKMNTVDENGSVKSKSSLVSHKVLKKSRSQLSRLKRLLLGRFMR